MDYSLQQQVQADSPVNQPSGMFINVRSLLQHANRPGQLVAVDPVIWIVYTSE